MASNSNRKSGSSGRSGPRKRVVIGADETVRVRYKDRQPQVEAERRSTTRQNASVASRRAGVGRPAPSKQGRRISSAKREERERRQRAIRWKRLGVLLLWGACAVGLVWGLVALYRAPVFEVKEVRIEGNRHLADADVVGLARIERDATLVRLPVADIETRIERSPWIVDAQVAREFPGTVAVTVVERVPAAVVDAGGTNLWTVSADGYWLAERGVEDTSAVVIRDLEEVNPIVGARISSKELLNAVRIAVGLSAELKAMTRAISAQSIDKTALITDEDIEIYIGDSTDLAAKDRVAREILEREKGKVVYINVRVVDRPTWRGLDTD